MKYAPDNDEFLQISLSSILARAISNFLKILPGGTAFILGTGTLHQEGFQFSQFGYKEQMNMPFPAKLV